jgi:predicted amidohydrolase
VYLVFFLSVAGDQLVVVNMGFAKVGLACCFDYRFPLLFQHYATHLGVDIVLVPAACTVPTGKVHWECLLRSRAIENQICILAAAQAGEWTPVMNHVHIHIICGQIVFEKLNTSYTKYSII